jgi:hypothetical protein
MKTLITAPLLVISSAFAGDITNFGATMPNGDDYSTPFPYWLIFYFFCGIWLCTHKNSPLYGWANEHPVISVILLVLLPLVINWILKL